MSTMTTTALAVDYPSHRRSESIEKKSKKEMCICVCRGISTTIFCFCTVNSVDYQQIIERERERKNHKRSLHVYMRDESTDQRFDKRVAERGIEQLLIIALIALI